MTTGKPTLPYGRQLIDDDDVAAVVEQLRGDWLTQGPTVARFEEALCAATGARYAVAVANGTAALHLACLAAGVGPGDATITSTNTFVASANAARYCGARPRLVDVNPETGLLSLASLRAAVDALRAEGTPAKVITPVDFAGSVADLGAVRELADRAGALVIEDASHSLGTTYEHGARRAGDGVHAHMATLSFHPVKNITTGEGGAVTTNDEALFRALCDLRTHGITKDPTRLTQNDGPWYYEQQSLGYNYRITDVQCALGVSQAAKLARFVARRRTLAARYDRALSAPPFAGRLRPLAVPAGVESAYHLYIVRLLAAAGEPLTAVAERRLALYHALRAENIVPQVHYIPVHRQPDFRAQGLATGDFGGAEAYYAGCLSLPMFPAMKDADVDRVVDAVGKAIG